MIVGVGIDIVRVERIARSLERWGDKFKDRILCEEEKRSSSSTVSEAAYLARQFAAKEAVSKALGSGMRLGVHFRSIKILRMASGAPCVELVDGALRRAMTVGCDSFHVSISDETDYAIAYVIAERR
mgnify:CR=1 FL=1